MMQLSPAELYDAMKRLTKADLNELCFFLSNSYSDLVELSSENLPDEANQRSLKIVQICQGRNVLPQLQQMLDERYHYTLPLKEENKAKPRSTAELPFLSADVVHRDQDIEELEQELESSDVLVIHGKGGQGKTTFAALFAQHWFKKGNEYRVYWYDRTLSQTRQTGDEIIGRALEQMGQSKERTFIYDQTTQQNRPIPGELAERLYHTLQGASEQWLIVISGLDEEDVDGEYLRDSELAILLRRASGGLGGKHHLLLTARSTIENDSAYGITNNYPLGSLSEKQGALLIKKLLHGRQPIPNDAKLEQAAGPGYADGYPLALTMLARLLKHPTSNADPATYLDTLLADKTVWLKGEEAKGLLNTTWNVLKEEQHHVLRCVATFSGPVSGTDLMGLDRKLNAMTKLKQAAIEEMVRRDWVQVEQRSRGYTMHPMIRQYVRERLAGAMSGYHQAAAKYYRIEYHRNHPDAHTQPAKNLAEVQPLLDAYDQLLAARDYQAAAELLYSTPFEYMSGGDRINLCGLLARWSEFSRLQVMLEPLVNAPASALRDGSRAAALGNLGSTYSALGEYDKAIDYHTRALAINEQIGDRRSQASSLDGLGNAYFGLDVYDKAIGYHTRALAIREQISDLHGQANALGGLGSTYRSLSDYDKAIDHYTRSLAIREQIGDRSGQASALDGLGYAYINYGEVNKGIHYCKQGLEMDETLGNQRSQGVAWNNIGEGYAMLGQQLDALACYLKAQDFHERTLQPDKDTTRKNIAKMHEAVDDTQWLELEEGATKLAADPNWYPWNDAQIENPQSLVMQQGCTAMRPYKHLPSTFPLISQPTSPDCEAGPRLRLTVPRCGRLAVAAAGWLAAARVDGQIMQ